MNNSDVSWDSRNDRITGIKVAENAKGPAFPQGHETGTVMTLCLFLEYNGLYNAIKVWDFEEIEQMSTYKKLLERIEASFIKQIKPCEIITRMTDCFVSREVEEIRAVSRYNYCNTVQ